MDQETQTEDIQPEACAPAPQVEMTEAEAAQAAAQAALTDETPATIGHLNRLLQIMDQRITPLHAAFGEAEVQVVLVANAAASRITELKAENARLRAALAGSDPGR